MLAELIEGSSCTSHKVLPLKSRLFFSMKDSHADCKKQ